MRLIPPKYRRGVRVAKYTLLTLAGGAAFFAASAVLTSALGVMVYAWAIMLFFGGAISLLGAATDWWLGEFVGCPAIFFVFFMFTIVFIVTGVAEPSPPRISFGLIFASFAAWVMARFIDIWNLAASSKGGEG
jgi:NADH:ubiquinone oxidoreductase subunit 6 (subunit J)